MTREKHGKTDLAYTDVVYVCDREACPVCHPDICSHTYDIRHAKNFEKFDGLNRYGNELYIERRDDVRFEM